MAAHDPSTLPQYYGQQLQDGTIMESPPVPPRHTRGSSDSRHELLRLPMQPHQAHLDQNMDPVSPVIAADPNGLGINHRTSNRRLGGFADPNGLDSPSAYRHQRGANSQDLRPHNPTMSHRGPYVEDYPSDEEYEPPQNYRRRPSRRHGPPPSAYGNDPRTVGRYTTLPGRGSIDTHQGYSDTPHYKMHYGSDDDYAPRRPPLRVTGNGGGDPPRRPPTTEDVMRLPWAMWMGSDAKNHFVAFVGEFVGTTMFLFFAFSGTQVANIGSSADSDSNTTTGEATGFSPNVLLYIALVFSFSLMVNVWVFFRISGGLFNPAVTFAMLLCRALSPIRAFLLLAAQIAGAIFSSFLVSVLFPTDFNVRTTLSEGTSLAQGVFIEAVLTAELVFTIFMLAKEKHKG